MSRSAFKLFSLCLFFGLLFFSFSKQSFAETSPFRGAASVTTDEVIGNTYNVYTDLSNCSETDGLTCSRGLGTGYGNIYFRDFGDFGIPEGATVTHIRIRVTGKTQTPSLAPFAALSRIGSGSSPFYESCQNPDDHWRMYALRSSIITVYNVTTPLTNGYLADCLTLSNIETSNFIFQVHYANANAWSANIDNFEIAFDYTTPAPTPSPSPSPTPTPPPPFLDLPWDYDCQQIPNEKVISECESRRKENKGKILTFEEAALEINSYFDHEYPLQSRGRDLFEPLISRDSTVTFMGYPRRNIPNDRVWYSSHDGYDYGRGAGAHNGDPIYPAAPGTAEYKYDKAGGHTILIDHHNGYQTRYYHLQDDSYFPSQVGVKKEVARSTMIGKVGSTGEHTSGSHIHIGVFFDKNYIEGGENNFTDYEPMGATDPFGWQSEEPDPWENYSFFYNGQERTGSKSYYLWKKQIDNLNANLSANGGVFTSGRNTVTVPSGATDQNLLLKIISAPIQKISDLIVSIGSSVDIKAYDPLGIQVTSFNTPITVGIDFPGYDLSRYLLDTISIYSSNDGINWQKEETNVDLINEKATAEVDHLTYFALMAERVDTVAASTSAILSGEEGELGWYRSDVSVVLNATDNEGGLGVDYILYKSDGGDWREYIGSLEVSEEGKHTLEFYSVDNDENIEDVKSVAFSIDKTPPEAEIQLNPATLDIDFLGKDGSESAEVTTYELPKKKTGIDISDKAGNTLTLTGKDKEKGKNAKVVIESLQYNDSELIDIDPTSLFVTHRLDENKLDLRKLTQTLVVKGEMRVKLVYSEKTGTTQVITKVKGQKKIKEEFEGIRLLKITTDNGTLDYSY